MKPVITGASGFIGRHLTPLLPDAVALSRADFDQNDAELARRCAGADVLIHLAGRAHRHDEAAGIVPMYHAENVLLTRRVLEIARQSNIPHVIFLSTIGVHGSHTGDTAFSERSRFQPETPYAHSKVEAETAVIDFCGEHGMFWTILRPTLVYGDDAPGNIGMLQKMLRKNLPLPFGALRNRRSLISVENLCDVILRCANSVHARNQVYVVSDGIERSTPELVTMMAQRLNVTPRLFAVPVILLKAAALLTGRAKRLAPLWNDLRVDNTKAVTQLGWSPKQG